MNDWLLIVAVAGGLFSCSKDVEVIKVTREQCLTVKTALALIDNAAAACVSPSGEEFKDSTKEREG